MNDDEKEFLRSLVKKELERVKDVQKKTSIGSSPAFLKAEHETVDFLKGLLEKLK